MLRKKYPEKAQSTIEYVFFLMIVLTIFVYFQKYLVKGIAGRFRTVGDSFAQGRLYDGNREKTIECSFDVYTDSGLWYDSRCFYDTCGIKDCVSTAASEGACRDCITSCVIPGGICDPHQGPAPESP